MSTDRQSIIDACESPIEAILIPAIVARLHGGVEWELQREIQCGPHQYRADLCLSYDGRVIVVECDGKDYHDYADDRTRDIRMLVAGGVTDVIRFTGGCIYADKAGCEDWMDRYFRFLFDADSPRFDHESLILTGMVLRHTFVKPTLRCLMPAFRHDLPPIFATHDNYKVLGRGPTGVVVQIRWPYRERSALGKVMPGAGIIKLGDYLLMENWDADRDDRDYRREVQSWQP